MTQQLPQGFTVSATTWDDLAAVTNLTRINEIALYGKPETTEDDIRTHWQGPTFNLATDAWVVKSPQAKIIGASESLTGATRLYERAGMRVVREYKSYEKELRAGKELGTQTVEV